MATSWLLALKAIPWSDVIEHAPTVLNAARKLMDRQKAEPASAPAAAHPGHQAPSSLGELADRLTAVQGQLDQQANTQAALTKTLAELAEQNTRLITAVDTLRLRTRVLLWTVGVQLVGVVLAAWWWLAR